jgi:hypothetical protein
MRFCVTPNCVISGQICVASPCVPPKGGDAGYAVTHCATASPYAASPCQGNARGLRDRAETANRNPKARGPLNRFAWLAGEEGGFDKRIKYPPRIFSILKTNNICYHVSIVLQITLAQKVARCHPGPNVSNAGKPSRGSRQKPHRRPNSKPPHAMCSAISSARGALMPDFSELSAAAFTCEIADRLLNDLNDGASEGRALAATRRFRNTPTQPNAIAALNALSALNVDRRRELRSIARI